jgi:hypothetical protein
VAIYRYKLEYKPTPEELRTGFAIWDERAEHSVFKPLAPSGDEMWSEAEGKTRSFGSSNRSREARG